MPDSATLIAALKFSHGVVIAADSQTSEPVGQVRWPKEKLEPIGQHPVVVGFSGDTGIGGRARQTLNTRLTHINMVNRLDRLRNNLRQHLNPFYEEIKKNNQLVTPFQSQFWSINLHGLIACWADGGPHIIEFAPNGSDDTHNVFHAIGSASNTAYAIFRTLGGPKLIKLNEERALWVTFRILKTSINVEMSGVSEPVYAWVVTDGKAKKVSDYERDAFLHAIEEWENQEFARLIRPDTA